MIDPNKTYCTRDGRAVRIYATDGAVGTKPIHGAFYDHKCGWRQIAWEADGYVDLESHPCPLDLIEVTLADELRDQIPWSVLRPEIRWVAAQPKGFAVWFGFPRKPERHADKWRAAMAYEHWSLEGVAMPEVDPTRWRETLVKRPESDEDYRLAP